MRGTSPASTSSARRNGNSFSSLLNFGEPAAHEALDGVDHAFGALDEGLARAVADSDGGPASAGCNGIERDHRRHEIRAVDAGNYHRLVAFHDMRPGNSLSPGQYQLRVLPPWSPLFVQSSQTAVAKIESSENTSLRGYKAPLLLEALRHD